MLRTGVLDVIVNGRIMETAHLIKSLERDSHSSISDI